MIKHGDKKRKEIMALAPTFTKFQLRLQLEGTVYQYLLTQLLTGK
jgi:hypothetical protein